MINKYEPFNLFSNFSKSAERFPDQTIQFDEPLPSFPELTLSTTYLESKKALIVKASQLQKLGIVKSNKVILYKSAQFDTYLLAVALAYIGAVPIMISPHLPVETMDILTERLGNPWLICDFATQKRSQQLQKLDTNQLIFAEKINDITIETLSSQIKLPDDMISYMTHTSGTTGVPKLIAHSANSMGWRIKWQKNILSLIRKRGLVAFHISPVHSRFNIGISSLMAKGFPLLSIANPNLKNVAFVLRKCEPFIIETHPNHFVQWTQLAKEKPEVFASVKYYHSTFDAINKETMAIFLRTSKYRKPIFLQVYGQSECGPMIMRFHTKSSLKRANARVMGVGMLGLTKARIVDQNGRVQAAGTPGNIQMLSKGRALTYFNEDQRFNENVYGKWWDSGDYGVKNRLGSLSLLDRQVDLIQTIDSTLAIEDRLLDQLTFLDEVIIIRGKEGKPQPIVSVRAGQKMDFDRWFAAISDFPHLNEPIMMDYDKIPRTATMKVQRLRLEKALTQSE
ncbi:acyl-CoA synthetase [Listeria sp. PSOL-1]|uniref:AMP-binding protein n=1 Tax=Listeria sp. PSOL-1 TaxID=1844999 RepID=UPI0013D417D2|nr:acyl-CoA synthetase [Listeria sp. PSOL-1]